MTSLRARQHTLFLCPRRTCLTSNPYFPPSLHIIHRLESNFSKVHRSPTPWRQDSSNEPSVFIQDNFAKHTIFTVDFFRRLFKFSLVGVLATGVTCIAAYEGAHIWVEKVSLAPENDAQVRRWEWDQEAEKWSGGPMGGTDPALGLWRGRHAVRGAWMAQHWGTGAGASVIGSKIFTSRGPSGVGGLNIIEPRLEVAQEFLSVAISVAEERLSTGKLQPQTLLELLSRHAGILERIGSSDALFESRSQLERVWAGLPRQRIDSARTALKLGDLNHRLGDPDAALVWWARAIQVTPSEEEPSVNMPPIVPASGPSSPLAQRTLASTLVSLSAFYATSGQLRQAQAVEEAALALLQSMRPSESELSSSPPQILHALYLLHRSSLISIHLAEVLFTLHNPLKTTLELLNVAAASSERVALALTGLPRIHPDAPDSKIPHPPASQVPLLEVYSVSQSMARPASSLLRDARRTAAEVWNLIGVLTEEAEGSAPEKALECYERALGWAGVAPDGPGGIAQAGDGTLEAEWKVLWRNYSRIREAIRK
jgi:tetratricopeptide (TPR) repeat protein